MLPIRVGVFLLGVLVAGATASSAVQTFVVPRALPVRLSRLVFRSLRWVFSRSATSSRRGYAALDRRMAFYAPTSLLMLPAVWLALVLAAFAGMYWAVDGGSVWAAVETSGSSLLTLGFRHPGSRVTTLLSFAEAGSGIALLALLITYLPTIYGAFTRREVLVSQLEVRAGSPPWAVTMLQRYQLIGLLERSDELFERAEEWFADIEESHTSLGSLAFFRSPQPHRSWVTAAGTILDGAALSMAVVDVEGADNPHAALCIRSGYLALRRISDFFGLPYDPDPAPDDPISITREEFDSALSLLESVGTPLKADRDQAWRDFAGWRVNYDTVLLQLAALCLAPPAPWTTP
ncbi:MAG: hypothetical protein QOF60_862 [Actinomycetota bacterium]|nr:hypothetical protein [Actinomycetota bacterium]